MDSDAPHLFLYPGGNYLRLIISWVQLLVLLLMLFLTLRSFRNVKIDLKRRRIQVLLGGGWILLALLRLLRSPLYSLLYRYPATDFNTVPNLLLRTGDVLLLVLFAVLLTATVCAFRKKSA